MGAGRTFSQGINFNYTGIFAVCQLLSRLHGFQKDEETRAVALGERMANKTRKQITQAGSITYHEQ